MLFVTVKYQPISGVHFKASVKWNTTVRFFHSDSPRLDCLYTMLTMLWFGLYAKLPLNVQLPSKVRFPVPSSTRGEPNT
jgi:hypothetical protein